MSVDGNALVHYFEGNRLVGTRLQYCCGYAPSKGERRSAYWPNTAFFCPTCGEIWGRAVLDHQFQYSPIPQASWAIESRRCVEHGDGLFLSGYGESHLPSCSRELLQREALILCFHQPTKEFSNVL